jgi:hypothetical protein
VQIDQVLTALQGDTREDLKKLLRSLSTAYSGEGAAGYNRSQQYWEPAYKNSALVNDATLGIAEHDLSGYIKGAGAVAEALDANAPQLKALITDFNRTAGAFAVRTTSCATRWRSCRARSGPDCPPCARSTRRSRRSGAWPSSCDRARAPRARRSTRRCRSSASCAAWSPAGGPRAGRRPAAHGREPRRAQPGHAPVPARGS